MSSEPGYASADAVAVRPGGQLAVVAGVFSNVLALREVANLAAAGAADLFLIALQL